MRGTLAVASAAIAFGTYGILSTFALRLGLGAGTILFWRFTVATLVLCAVARATRQRVPALGDLLRLVALGALYAGMSLAYLQTVRSLGAAYAVLFLYAYPAVVVIVERTLGTRIGIARTVAALLVPAATALLASTRAAAIPISALAIATMSAVAYGVFLVGASRAVPRAAASAATAVVLAGAALVVSPLLAMERAAVSLPAAGVMLVVGVVATALPLALLLYGNQRIGAPRAGILGTLEPLCGVGLACAVNGEHLAPAQIAGAAALLVTSLLQARP